MAWSSPLGRTIAWTLIAVVVAVLYLPMVPPPLFSLNDAGPAAALRHPTLHWYGEIWSNAVLVGAVWTSLAAALVVGLVTPVLALLAAMAVRELKMPRLVLLVVMTPLFIPGVSMGLSLALFFRQLGIPPSLLTILIIHVLWALPFATLIILTVMAGFDPVYLEVAYMHGANRWRAFRDVELPLISPGIVSAGTFAMIFVQRNRADRTGPRSAQHGADLYLVDLQANRALAVALRADEPSHPPDLGDGRALHGCRLLARASEEPCLSAAQSSRMTSALGSKPTVTSEPAELNSRRIEVATTGWPSARRRR